MSKSGWHGLVFAALASLGAACAALELVRWDAAARAFEAFPVDVEPSEFIVLPAAERTLVVLHTDFVEEPR